MTTLPATLSTEIATHGQRTYPEECVGALIGSLDRDAATFVVDQLLPLDNDSAGSGRREFSIDPRDYLRAERAADAAGKRLIGFYHSHPDAAVYFSETDLRFAQPNFVYIIVSIQGQDGPPRAVDMGAFVLAASGAASSREELSIGET